MLLDLYIQNLVLMESCHLQFVEGLTALTGETGAGKTAILHSLKLLLGQKLDPSLIRFGEKKGSIQGRFQVCSPLLKQLLLDGGFDLEEEDLILFREVFSDGKSKSFIQNRPVSLSFLQKVASHLIQIVDQSSYHELRLQEQQRLLLDLYASLEKEVSVFSKKFEQMKHLHKKEEELKERDRQKERELDFCLSQAQELTNLSLKEGEEEKLFEEYSFISQSEDVTRKVDETLDLINGSILSSLKRSKQLLNTLSSSHSLFKESQDLLENLTPSVEEVLFLLRKALSYFEINPHKLEVLEEKLSLIHKMKKKYGPSPASWEIYRKDLQKKIALFDSLEDDQNNLEQEKKELEQELSLLSQDLSKKRLFFAQEFSQKLHSELKDLNMGEALIDIRVEKQPRSNFGEDKISFWLKANPGEPSVLVKDSSSGGELSRLLLACKLCLAEKNSTPTLIFDEIDANVGGETARLIGEKLLALSTHRQVLCITHFPQVACQAHLHLKVQKNAVQERTFATIEPLSGSLREKELLRMLGGRKEAFSNTL